MTDLTREQIAELLGGIEDPLHWHNSGRAKQEMNNAAPDLARQLLATHAELTKMETRAKEAEDRNAEWADRTEAAERLAADRLDHIVAAEAQLAEAQKREARYQEALIWCSGSEDFQADGQARAGWLKLCAPLIDRAALAQQPPASGDDGRG